MSLKVIDYIRNVAEYIETPEGSTSASQMLERFLFTGAMQYSLISKLSGGEKRRLYLLKVLMEAPNVLILDEPTNDLDISTLNVLEDYLDSYDGIVLTVSHDRYFLDRIVNRIFAFEGEGKIAQYEGGFTDYKERIAEEERNNPKILEEQKQSKSDNYKSKPKESKLKFSYKEQREFDTIDEDILKLEEQIEIFENEMVGAATDYSKLKDLMAKKEQAEKMLEEKMDRWVYLNDLAEQMKEQK